MNKAIISGILGKKKETNKGFVFLSIACTIYKKDEENKYKKDTIWIDIAFKKNSMIEKVTTGSRVVCDATIVKYKNPQSPFAELRLWGTNLEILYWKDGGDVDFETDKNFNIVENDIGLDSLLGDKDDKDDDLPF